MLKVWPFDVIVTLLPAVRVTLRASPLALDHLASALAGPPGAMDHVERLDPVALRWMRTGDGGGFVGDRPGVGGS